MNEAITPHAATFADHAWFGSATVSENVRLAHDTYRLRFQCPQIAERITPGQFVMLRLAGYSDPLLGRPLALYDTVLDDSGRPAAIDVVYLVVGKLTRKLACLTSGQSLEVWGPLGNGFPPQPAEHLIMVAGGIGQTPFVALAQEYLGLRNYGTPPRQVAQRHRLRFATGLAVAIIWPAWPISSGWAFPSESAPTTAQPATRDWLPSCCVRR